VFPLLLFIFSVFSVVTLRSIDPAYGTNQLLFFGVSFLAYAVLSSIPFLWLRRGRWWAYGGVIALLLITLIVGTATNGSVSWLRIGSYRIQPSEFLKPVLLFLLGIEVASHPLHQLPKLLRFLAIVGIPLGLVLLQPDLGTMLVTTAGIAAVYFFSAPTKRYTAWLSGIAVMVILVSWLFLLQPYQKDRIRSFIAPQSDPLGSGYNARQAMIAVGSGEMWGKGFGNGLQSNLRFLPERHTDFLFATFSEETGFIGNTLLISLYAFLFFWIARLLADLDSPEKIYIALGLSMALFAQTTINIGMNIGIAPITGVPLPLFSLGGSSLVATAVTLGIIESLRRSSLPRVERRM